MPSSPRDMFTGPATARRIDALVAAGLFAWAAPDVPWWWRPPSHVPADPVVLGYLALALASAVPFWWRRRFPLTVLLATAGVLVIRHVLRQNETAAFAATLVAAYGLGAYATGARRYARWLGRLSLLVAVVVTLTSYGHRMDGVPLALAGAAFLTGDAATARRNEVATAVEAAHLAERTRIARELHDVLAHQLSAIAVQAGVARMTGMAPAEALGTVERLSREALTELSHLLGALRRDEEHRPDRRPAPSLAEIGTLLAAARDAGVPADLTVRGRERELTPGLQVSVYRIVQESLTNVTKHAPGAKTRVTLTYLDDRLTLDIVNGTAETTVSAATRQTGGRGLIGMRERAELYGGVLDAAARPTGFTVSAALPYETP